ncbi:MAG: oxygen-independent coproporphyrinogen III oxidase [Myxococcota bacterium]
MTRTQDHEDADAALDPEQVEATLLRHAGAGPRYTSYPTAPVWSDAYDGDDFASDLARAEGPLSLYVHVPFCRSLCHFCACNRMVTQKAELPERFLDTIAREVEAVREAVGRSLPAAQHHWGGGTPTHLTPDQIHRLFRTVNEAFPADADAEISIEADPRVTDEVQLEALRACGFRRLSLGVQDFDARVQRAIHREQSVAQTAALTEGARALGFRGVSFDLIYGLPFQTVESMERTLDEAIALAPDRIAIYGYAHVTWIAKQQRGFERGDLPGPRERLRIWIATIRRLVAAGYAHVGLDHFARPEDPLVQALRAGTLRRNFMGYTTQAGLELIGLGPSGISELGASYAQNERDLAAWQEALATRGLATLRGHRLSADDRERRFVIQSLLCGGALDADAFRASFGTAIAERFAPELEALAPYEAEGLLEIEGDGSIAVGALGRLVLRNVAMVFDAYLPRQREGDRPVFSQTI